MARSRWTWAAAASAAMFGIAAAVVAAGAVPARSDDSGDEEHVPPADFAYVTSAVANWDSPSDRDAALAAYLGFASAQEMLAPYEDANWIDSH